MTSPASEHPSQPRPPAPTYTLVRITAYTFAILCVLIASVLYLSFKPDTLSYWDLSRLLTSVHFLTLPWLGWLVIVLTNNLKQIDAHSFERFEKAGLLLHYPDLAPGSAVPYIAPFCVFGWALTTSALLNETLGSTERGLIIGAGLIVFLMGFAADELRQLIWRQEFLARIFLNYRALDTGTSWTSLFFASVTIQNAILAFLTKHFLFALFAGLGISLYFLGRALDSAVYYWQEAVQKQAGLACHRINWPIFNPGPVARVRWVGLLAIYPVLNIQMISNFAPKDFGIFLFCSILCLTLATGYLITQIVQWRHAHRLFWMLQSDPKAIPSAGLFDKAEQLKASHPVLWVGKALLWAQFGTLLFWSYRMYSGSELFIYFIGALLAFQYFPYWAYRFLNEILVLEKTLAEFK